MKRRSTSLDFRGMQTKTFRYSYASSRTAKFKKIHNTKRRWGCRVAGLRRVTDGKVELYPHYENTLDFFKPTSAL